MLSAAEAADVNEWQTEAIQCEKERQQQKKAAALKDVESKNEEEVRW